MGDGVMGISQGDSFVPCLRYDCTSERVCPWCKEIRRHRTSITDLSKQISDALKESRWKQDVMTLMLYEGMHPSQEEFEGPWELDPWHLEEGAVVEFDTWDEMLEAVAKQHDIRKED